MVYTTSIDDEQWGRRFIETVRCSKHSTVSAVRRRGCPDDVRSIGYSLSNESGVDRLVWSDAVISAVVIGGSMSLKLEMTTVDSVSLARCFVSDVSPLAVYSSNTRNTFRPVVRLARRTIWRREYVTLKNGHSFSCRRMTGGAWTGVSYSTNRKSDFPGFADSFQTYWTRTTTVGIPNYYERILLYIYDKCLGARVVNNKRIIIAIIHSIKTTSFYFELRTETLCVRPPHERSRCSSVVVGFLSTSQWITPPIEYKGWRAPSRTK